MDKLRSLFGFGGAKEEEGTRETESGDTEKKRLFGLPERLEKMSLEKHKGEKDVVMQKLIKYLRAGDAYLARVFLTNESDKFNEYRKDGIPLIIEELYGGEGSPWFSVEAKLKKEKQL